MKGKAMLDMGFSNVFQAGIGKSLQLLQVAGPFSSIVVFVQALANCRKFGVDSGTKSLSFQLLTIGALSAI
jgi:hypothetical protein